MYFEQITQNYKYCVVVCGAVCLAFATYFVPIQSLDIKLVLLFGFTVGLSSRVTVQIPRFKSHISVSDTFIFLVLLMYGGELAVILAATEAFFSSWRFCSKKLTVLFNSATMAISTSCVVLVLRMSGLDSVSHLQEHSNFLPNFITTLSLIALTQFVVNTAIVSFHDSMKSAVPLLEIWRTKYVWSYATYFFGAITAGILLLLTESIGFGVIVVSFPVTYFIFLAYRMYLENVEISMRQAEQAKEYAKILEDRSHALRESEERFRSAFDNAPIGIALVSISGRWLKVNRAMCEILGYSEQEFMARDFRQMVFAEDLTITLDRVTELSTGKIASFQLEQRYRHKNGNTVWASLSVSASGDIGDENSNLIFQIQDITEKKSAENKLQYEATHDALTRLPNRAHFMSQLDGALTRTLADPMSKVSVLFIDLDRFKYINDSLGHFVGDELLIAIAQRLSVSIRPPDLVARLGGDEFVVLVEGNYRAEEITGIAERIQDCISSPFKIQGHEVFTSASIGILNASDQHHTSADIVRDADTAMYHAKRSGRARHEVFVGGMREIVCETLMLETDLRRAIQNRDIEVQYQPIVSLTDGSLDGLEALARWEHPRLGVIPPDRFIPLAEEIGLIHDLGDHIMRTACTSIGQLRRSLPVYEHLKLSVNLSSNQFANGSLVKDISQILNETGFPPGRLKIEIAETAFFEHHDMALDLLGQLRAIGIETDVDDFGTGYSNLAYLVRLPISTLKIDRSFVTMMAEKPANREVIRTVIALAGNLGLKVVAEGIETEEQMESLRFLGCDMGQGYYFAKPMSIEETLGFLVKRERDSIPLVQTDQVPIVAAIQ